MGRRSSAAARFGSPSWTRTNDTAVNSRVLYRLSYGGIFEVARPSQTRPLRMLALPIFPVRLQTSIVGRSELNFRVRDGNGWTLALINTNCCAAFAATTCIILRALLFVKPFREIGDPYGNRTHVCGVRGRRLNRLTNGPYGTPSGTRTLDTLIKSQVLYQLS